MSITTSKTSFHDGCQNFAVIGQLPSLAGSAEVNLNPSGRCQLAIRAVVSMEILRATRSAVASAIERSAPKRSITSYCARLAGSHPRARSQIWSTGNLGLEWIGCLTVARTRTAASTATPTRYPLRRRVGVGPGSVGVDAGRPRFRSPGRPSRCRPAGRPRSKVSRSGSSR